MGNDNQVTLHVKSTGENVSLVRMMAGGFLYPYDLTLDMLDEIKIALSEAVSNCMIHGYEGNEDQTVTVMMSVQNQKLSIEVQDTGVGITDITQAMEPAFSTREEHMGLGFVFMQTFMDELEVFSEPGKGTRVVMRKQLAADEQKMSEVG
ncbi:MAG: anti-sigma F factor [Peptococcaceae bacterium]|nr:anti-sigma F factor [Peptococcaceae bacterium]